MFYIPCEPNTTYTVQRIIPPSGNNKFAIAYSNQIPSLGMTTDGFNRIDGAFSITITTDSTANYLIVWYYVTDFILTEQQILDTIQVEKRNNSYRL